MNYLDKRTQTYYCEPLERFRMERCLVSSQHGTYEIRCPVHGFIDFNDWERQIINHRAFQRLRRIRQLAWTDYIYPGATHTRFEHSLGVMHAATRLFDAVVKNSFELLQREYSYSSPDDEQLRRRGQLSG